MGHQFIAWYHYDFVGRENPDKAYMDMDRICKTLPKVCNPISGTNQGSWSS